VNADADGPDTRMTEVRRCGKKTLFLFGPADYYYYYYLKDHQTGKQFMGDDAEAELVLQIA
jgi:hypothetical protein